MNLFILRHGIAVDPGALGIQTDSQRPLTEEGKIQMGKIAGALKKLGVSWDLILSSPFLRAKQTAEIVAKNLNLTKILRLSNHLACGANPKKFIEEINLEYSGAANVLVVGHEPFLSGLIAVLVTGREDSEFMMKKGSICKLSVSNLQYKRCAGLNWLLTPKQLCAMVC